MTGEVVSGITEAELAFLADLEVKLSPAPWFFTSCGKNGHEDDPAASCWRTRCAYRTEMTREDDRAVAAMRNAFPRLIEAARELAALKARPKFEFGTRECKPCGKQTRDETAGCDHCDLEDK